MTLPISPSPVTSFGVSGGVSGNVGSGTNEYFINPSGTDWMIETQSLTVDYYRLPFYTGSRLIDVGDFDLSKFGWGLSGVEGYASGYIYDTRIIAKVTAYYSRVKQSNVAFGTSSFLQPQKFTVYPVSADHVKSYGTPASGTLGPRGHVTTSQKYIYRRPWLSATDTTGYASVNDVYSYVMDVCSIGTGSRDPDLPPTDYRRCPGGVYLHDLLFGRNNVMRWAYSWVPLQGQYLTSRDTILHPIDLLDGIGENLMKDHRWFERDGTLVPKLAGYEVSRHDYT